MIYDYALLQIIKENQYVIILQLTKCRDVIFHECNGRKCVKKNRVSTFQNLIIVWFIKFISSKSNGYTCIKRRAIKWHTILFIRQIIIYIEISCNISNLGLNILIKWIHHYVQCTDLSINVYFFICKMCLVFFVLLRFLDKF